jgi:hypothetical protein
MTNISPDQMQVITQLDESLPELIGTKKEYVEYQEKRYKFAYQLPYSSVNWYKNRGEILAVNIETGVASLLPKREPTSIIDDGLALLRGLIGGEFGDDYDLATVKILMRNFDEVKPAIWSRLTPEEKKKISQLPKESVRVEKDVLVVDTELSGVISPIGIDDNLKNVKTINYQGKVFTRYGQGVFTEFADEKETQTILLDILENKICVCDYLPLPPKRRPKTKAIKQPKATTIKKEVVKEKKEAVKKLPKPKTADQIALFESYKYEKN